MLRGGKVGLSTGTIYEAPRVKNRRARRRRAEDAAWRAKNGPVVVSFQEPQQRTA